MTITMTSDEMIERMNEEGCVKEFSADPYVSDSCGAEVSCLGCGSCSAHCRCEPAVSLELLAAADQKSSLALPLFGSASTSRTGPMSNIYDVHEVAKSSDDLRALIYELDLEERRASGDAPCDDHNELACRECFPTDDDPVEFSETRRGYEACENWARCYDDLEGAPEGDWDR